MRPSVRTFAGFLALAAVLLCTAPSAWADPATYRTLLERATRILGDAEIHHRAGRAEEARSEARRALELLEEAARLRASAPRPAYLAVQATVFAGDRLGARTWVAELTRRSPAGERDPDVLVARGMIWLYLEGRPDHAVQSFERSARLAPRIPNRARDLMHYAALMAWGEEGFQDGELDAALTRFKAAGQLAAHMGQRRKQTAARGNAGIVLFEMGNYEDAEIVFLHLRRENPEGPLWSFFHGRSLRALDRLPEATEAFVATRGLVAEGGVPADHATTLLETSYEEGACLLVLAKRASDAATREEHHRNARRLLERYVEDVPSALKGQFALGRILYEVFQEPYAAMRHLERAYEIDPVCDQSLRLLIRIASRHGPPPAEDAASEAADFQAWTARREAWEKELEANADAWERARRRRQQHSKTGTDGCP